MSAPLPADIASVLQSLVQQQTAIFQQQAALLQIHGESVRLQRLLVERFLGSEVESVLAIEPAAPSAQPQWMSIPDTPSAPPAPTEPVPSLSRAAAIPTLATAPKSVSIEPAADPVPALPAAPEAPVTGASPSRAALYYQQRSPRVTPPAAMKPQDLELMRRMHEMSDASSLILQFGPFKGSTLAQVAMHNPEYIRQLVNRAERPEVRAAACRLVSAIEAVEEHKPRTARGAARRSSGYRAGPRG